MKYILSILLTLTLTALSAQNLPERGELRKGNKSYAKEEYDTAIEHYSKSMAIAPKLFEPRYNLANALIKSENSEGADKILTELAADSLQSDIDRSESFYNLGNSQVAQEKLEEALESYKDAIRLNPNDTEAKYNYSYVKTLLEQQQQNEDQQQDQDQDNQESGDEGENEENQDNQENQDEGEQPQDQQPQDGDDQEQEQDQQEQEQQPRDGEISEQELQQMLDAIQAQEDKTQEDLEEKARGVVVQGAKNW